MKTLNIGKAQAKQWKFLTDKHRHIAYGGARGGGKRGDNILRILKELK